MNNAEARIDRALAQVRRELERAVVKHAHSAHEGHSVIAAMAVRFPFGLPTE